MTLVGLFNLNNYNNLPTQLFDSTITVLDYFCQNKFTVNFPFQKNLNYTMQHERWLLCLNYCISVNKSYPVLSYSYPAIKLPTVISCVKRILNIFQVAFTALLDLLNQIQKFLLMLVWNSFVWVIVLEVSGLDISELIQTDHFRMKSNLQHEYCF